MYVLKLAARACISCGICADVCVPRAVVMRATATDGIEGKLTMQHPLLDTFPVMQSPAVCDGCMCCVVECPVRAISIEKQRRGECEIAREGSPCDVSP